MINPVNTSLVSSASEAEPRDIQGAARQFEALLLTQLLKAACDAETMLGGEADAGSRTAVEMAQEQFASALANQGGLGLARMISSSLKQPDAKR